MTSLSINYNHIAAYICACLHILFIYFLYCYSVHQFTTGIAPTTGELTAAFMRSSTLDEMMVQVRELRMQRSNVMASFRFKAPTPASSFYSSNATAIQLPSAASISEDVQFETPRRRVRAGDEYQRPPS